MSAMLSASGEGRASHCAPAYALPAQHVQNEDATRGTIRHGFMRRLFAMPHEKALELTPESERAYCESIDLEGLPLDPAIYRPEVAFAFDVKTLTARELGADLERRYDVGPTEIPGAADVSGRDASMVEIWDWKFHGFEAHTEPIATNGQMRFLALAAARAAGVSAARICLVHFGDDGAWWLEDDELDAFELDSIEAEVVATFARVEAARAVVAAGHTPDVTRGPWCRWCPASAACPAVTGLVHSLALNPMQIVDALRAILTPETAATARERLKEIKNAVALADAALRMFAEEQPIPLGEGRYYGRVMVADDEIEATKAHEVLERLYGRKAADAAMTWTTSKEGIKRGVKVAQSEAKATGAKVTQKALFEDAMRAIDDAGAIAHGTRPTLKEFTGRPALASPTPHLAVPLPESEHAATPDLSSLEEPPAPDDGEAPRQAVE